jgi:hypothetical protein
MNPATRNHVRHVFIAAVKDMDPTDAKVLQHLYSNNVTRIRRGGGPGDADRTAHSLIP